MGPGPCGFAKAGPGEFRGLGGGLRFAVTLMLGREVLPGTGGTAAGGSLGVSGDGGAGAELVGR